MAKQAVGTNSISLNRPAPAGRSKNYRQFRLVKFFSWASFIVMLIFSFPFSLAISQRAEKTLLESYENNALLVGENLNHQVFQRFVLPVSARFGSISLRKEDQRDLMDRVVKDTIHGFKVDLVNIYDISKGIIAYSTDKAFTGRDAKKTMGYKKAIEGKSSSGLMSKKDELWGLGIEIAGGERKLRTYVPFTAFNPIVVSGEYVAGVFEIIQDISKQYESIVRFRYVVFGLSILIMGLIFLALLMIVRKAEGLIDERALQQRRLEEQLHQAERLAALGEMVAGVSHEIKNPLGIIQSTADLLVQSSEADKTQKRLSGIIKEESKRLNDIVVEFLDFARPREPDLQETNLVDILTKNLEFLRPELEKRNILVSHDLKEKSLRLKADQDLLYRAFLNILLNAVQAVERNGRISLSATREKELIRVEINDTGPGIDADIIKKLFNPFFTTKEKGTGLGLSIVNKIIEAHNGAIEITSTGDTGTRVTVLLPRDP